MAPVLLMVDETKKAVPEIGPTPPGPGFTPIKHVLLAVVSSFSLRASKRGSTLKLAGNTREPLLFGAEICSQRNNFPMAAELGSRSYKFIAFCHTCLIALRRIGVSHIIDVREIDVGGPLELLAT
jgi:hypothetical protein